MLRPGDRVYLKRRARQRLRSYWGRRWDALDIRREVLRHDRPRYWIESIHLNGMYARLRRLPFLWYAGLFTVGRHLTPRDPSGRSRWYQNPVHLPIRGLGPRVMVFPAVVLDRVARLPLLGTPERYTGIERPGEPPASMRVRCVSFGVTHTIYARHGPRTGRTETLRLEGELADGADAGFPLVVPISEVSWKALVAP